MNYELNNGLSLFDFTGWFTAIIRRNRLAVREGFLPCVCSGTAYLEDMMEHLRTARAFACVSDVSEGGVVQHGGGYFMRRVFTAYIVARYDRNRQGDQSGRMDVCRELYRQVHSLLLREAHRLRSDLVYLDVDNIRVRDLGGEFFSGCTGLYFMASVDEPVDLAYRPEEWDDEGEEGRA